MEVEIAELVKRAIRLPVDVNGNPRYYIPMFLFTNKEGRFFRPDFCDKYRGKKFGPGWVFQSYCLEDDLKYSIENISDHRIG